MPLHRRSFIKHSAAAALALSMLSAGRVLGANEEVRVGLIGLGGRGTGAHLPRMEGQAGVQVVAVCDPDRQRMAACAQAIETRYGHGVEQHVDLRDLLARKDVDVVSNATQNYWHGLSTIWACEAGKHVYVEKPLSHYIWEGRQMVRAARKYNRIVQCGTQRRSEKLIIDGIAWVRAGNLGRIQYITAFANKRRASVGRRDTPLPIGDEVDYELWCGPARKLPIYRDRLQYDCSFDWNTGDGESCNQGVHEVDMARWCLGEERLPRRVISVGGRFVFNDAADVPNTQIIYYDYPTAPVLYEVHNMTAAKGSNAMPSFRGQGVGICVQCEGGYLNLPQGAAYDNQGKKVQSFSGGEDHFENFIAAVRSGRREDLRAEVLEGHRSTAITHVGNISYRLGRPATTAEIRREVQDTPLFAEMFERLTEHLAAHEIPLDKPTITLGPWLDVDVEHERFQDNAAANELVHGHYREPFVVPEVTA
jgi:predicted dehydrogenase